MTVPPPIDPAKPRAAVSREPLWMFLSLVGAMAVFGLASKLDLPLPRCVWRQLTGLPCPFCGGTRSLQAWIQLDLLQAFRLNPLVFLAAVTTVGWFAIWILNRLRRREHALPSLADRLFSRPGIWFLLAAVVINWIYLVLAAG